MEMISPGSRGKLQTSKSDRLAAWAAFYWPDRAGLKRAFFGPLSTSNPELSPVTVGSKKTIRRGSEGQALVEFALTLPFMVLLFVVLVELGLLIRSHMTITSSVREGVRAVSSRGNADPSALYSTGAGNQVNSRVGADGDVLLTQNINTALQQERQNVTLLMTYRADVTDSTSTIVTDTQAGRSVPTLIGYNGLGGQYGVLYNPTLSKFPFQEVFSYTVDITTGQKFFNPYVMSVNECKAIYGNSEPAKPQATTPAGSTYATGSNDPFCGDASNVSGLQANQGIDRTITLGTYSTTAGNASAIYSKPRYSGGVNCAAKGGTNSDKNDVLYLQTSASSSSAIQCWRYNFAPWYPSLRYSLDFTGNNVNLTPSSPGYYNYQVEDPSKFGDPSVFRSPDYAGVQIVYNHKWLLSFFPGSLTLSDRAVKVMEPVGGGFTKPGT